MTVPGLNRLGIVCIAVAVVLTATTDASAAPHYYGTLINGNASLADYGQYEWITTSVLESDDCSQFSDHEMWYGTVSGGAYWVEVGFLSGSANGSPGCVNEAIFWGDNRPGLGYTGHYPGYGWVLGDWYAAEVLSGGNNTGVWYVYLGGVNIGTSTSNGPGNNRYLMTGIETTNVNTGYVVGNTETWQEYDGTTWRNGWESPGFISDDPPYITYTNSNDVETAESL